MVISIVVYRFRYSVTLLQMELNTVSFISTIFTHNHPAQSNSTPTESNSPANQHFNHPTIH